jgi:CheY-like chemotaxis protein
MEAVEGLSNARERMDHIAAETPGNYFLMSGTDCAILTRVETFAPPLNTTTEAKTPGTLEKKSVTATPNGFSKGTSVPAKKARTVLIADDNAMMRRYLREYFQRAEFEVCGEAENGKEAVEKCIRLRPNLVVLDIAMPTLDGLDAARQLKTRLLPTTVIIFTLYAEDLSHELLLDAGVAAAVSKYDPPERLMEEARRLVKT